MCIDERMSPVMMVPVDNCTARTVCAPYSEMYKKLPERES